MWIKSFNVCICCLAFQVSGNYILNDKKSKQYRLIHEFMSLTKDILLKEEKNQRSASVVAWEQAEI